MSPRKKKILVSRTIVDQNKNTGGIDPVFTVIDHDGTEYKTSDIVILGASAIKYDPTAEPGQRVWIETFSKIVMYNGTDTETDNPIMETI